MSTGWHFLPEDRRLRDGEPAPADGVALRYEGPLELCTSGLHASRRILDALRYAPGPIVCRVRLGEEIIEGGDKLVATERTILWRYDATEVLQAFARACASDVLYLWDAPSIIRYYLSTGDESLREAAKAEAAAWAAAQAAETVAVAEAAAWAAAWAVTGWAVAGRAVAVAVAAAVAAAAAATATATATAAAEAEAAEAADAAWRKHGRRLTQMVTEAHRKASKASRDWSALFTGRHRSV